MRHCAKCPCRTSKIMSVGISSIPLSRPLSLSSFASLALIRRGLAALRAGFAVVTVLPSCVVGDRFAFLEGIVLGGIGTEAKSNNGGSRECRSTSVMVVGQAVCAVTVTSRATAGRRGLWSHTTSRSHGTTRLWRAVAPTTVGVCSRPQMWWQPTSTDSHCDWGLAHL